jgi:hypothetical protein
MQEESYAVLRHLEVNGPSNRTEVAGGLAARGFRAADATRTLNNLAALGYLAKDDTTAPINYVLTNKARTKLSSPYVPKAKSTKPRAPRQPRQPTQPPARPAATPRSEPARTWDPPRHPMHKATRPWQAQELRHSARPGAMDAFSFPSRFGNLLHYRDGRVTDLAGNPVTL